MPILGIVASSISGNLGPEGSLGYYALNYSSVGSPVGSVVFSSIPQNYKHLEIRAYLRNTSSGNGGTGASVLFNGDTTTSNYTYHRFIGNANTASSYGQNSGDFPMSLVAGGSQANSYSVSITSIFDYSSATQYKTTKLLNTQDFNSASPAAYIAMTTQLWKNQNAITQIAFTPAADNFAAGSFIALYGITG